MFCSNASARGRAWALRESRDGPAVEGVPPFVVGIAAARGIQDIPGYFSPALDELPGPDALRDLAHTALAGVACARHGAAAILGRLVERGHAPGFVAARWPDVRACGYSAQRTLLDALGAVRGFEGDRRAHAQLALLRAFGEAASNEESLITGLLLPDAPVVAWWPEEAPYAPSQSPLGKIAQRRITDAATATSTLCCVPQITSENTSRPSASVPNQCPAPGGRSTSGP